jgi:hypothetical protein
MLILRKLPIFKIEMGSFLKINLAKRCSRLHGGYLEGTFCGIDLSSPWSNAVWSSDTGKIGELGERLSGGARDDRQRCRWAPAIRPQSLIWWKSWLRAVATHLPQDQPWLMRRDTGGDLVAARDVGGRPASRRPPATWVEVPTWFRFRRGGGSDVRAGSDMRGRSDLAPNGGVGHTQ